MEALSLNVASTMSGDEDPSTGDALRWIQLHQAGEIKVGVGLPNQCHFVHQHVAPGEPAPARASAAVNSRSEQLAHAHQSGMSLLRQQCALQLGDLQTSLCTCRP